MHLQTVENPSKPIQLLKTNEALTSGWLRCSAGERSNCFLHRDEPFHGQTAIPASLETADVGFRGSKYTGELLLCKPMRRRNRPRRTPKLAASCRRSSWPLETSFSFVTNLGTSSRAVVRFYNKRGTAEQWIKEGKQAVTMTRLSCHRFRANEVRLWLSVIAYNLGNLWRRLALPTRVATWSLTSLQQRLVKTGGRLIKHARYYWLLLAESHLTRRLFAGMLRKIATLPSPAG